ncbi:MAG TPA: hypothetical protein VMO00_08620 [Methylomirabilota bacterium]|nr:hypothetical protein [Methylomirabilota bacterium]
MTKIFNDKKIIKISVLTAVGLSVFLAVKGTAFAEKMDLGQIPKSVVKGFCDTHGGTYADWGDAGSACLTGGGNSIYCDKNSNCTGYAKEPAQLKTFPKAKVGAARPTVGNK